MSEPLFADAWYRPEVRTDELRKEIQALYDLITELFERVKELEESAP